MSSQCLHLSTAGLKPRKKQPRWSCIAGVCAEGARAPHASKHIPFPVEPRLIHGVSPIEVGRIAEGRALKARDPLGKKLRRDGAALLAGVVSYPGPRKEIDEDPVDQDIYALWVRKTLAWLLTQFGEHLLSVVEHTDERYYHLHFFVVPSLGPGQRLNIDRLHPGYYARLVALAEGADKTNGERSYRKGMRQWQNAYHREVSEFFRHDRYGPRRARVTRREREMQKRMEEERKRMLKEIEQKAIDAENAARRRGWERYARPYATLQAAHAAEQARRQQAEVARAVESDRRRRAEVRCRQAEAEAAALRERLAALEEGASPRFAA